MSTMNSMKKRFAPTVEQIESDILTQLSNQYWAPYSNVPRLKFSAKIIEEIYQRELLGTKFATHRVMLLEFSQYLENYLWPNYSEQGTAAHALSIAVMINEKFRERTPAWECFLSSPAKFPILFRHLMSLSLQEKGLTFKEQTMLLTFFIHCFNSHGVDLIIDQTKKLVLMPIWFCILPSRREEIFAQNAKYHKYWRAIVRNYEKLDNAGKQQADKERQFLASHIEKFYRVLSSIPEKGDVPEDKIRYCERFLELLIDLESQLMTRRFFNTLLDDKHVLVVCRLSSLARRQDDTGRGQDGKLFRQLLEKLSFYATFEIDEVEGKVLTDSDMMALHYDQITSLQKAVFKHFPELQKFALANVGSIDRRETLMKHFKTLSNRKLHEIAAYLNMVSAPEDNVPNQFEDQFLLELLVSRHERRPSQLEMLNDMPLYPTEEIIWDENVVPLEFYASEGSLALPKLNLQFLTVHDYLLRNFQLFRLESTYEIRQDIEDAVSRLKPWRAEDGSCYFGGWARMAHPLVAFSVVEVAQPRLGENHPARVSADITINLNLRPEIKREWEGLRKHDVAFLLTVRPPNPIGTRYDPTLPFIPQVGLAYVRGCEIEGMLDENGKVIEEGPEPKPPMKGETRTFRVQLDCNQYQKDMLEISSGQEDLYATFNIILRRKPKENNFKAVLETIRDLMNTDCVIPDWLHNTILGYGDPAAACSSNMSNQIATMDWNDTFLTFDHLKSSFPGFTVRLKMPNPGVQARPPFRLTFPVNKKVPDDSGDATETSSTSADSKVILAEPHVIPNRGPFAFSQPKRNQVAFTPTQIEAIRSGMQPGLTMVVGPPGTGKTDVAVQIISNLYHNFPNERTLIVTHSNQALNQLFEKIMALDVEERHLLRLGHGEEALETEKDYSRYGRVNFVLARRLELLQEVSRLQQSLGIADDMSYTCETAGYFYIYQVLSRWEAFVSEIKPAKGTHASVEKIAQTFPFTKFFENAPQPLFKGRTFEEDWDIAEGCFRHIKKFFKQLEGFQAFELLRSGRDRARYLLIKEAKIIAMTCTHAALKRRDLVEAGFEYDNILMEESAQILEIETFIPLLLQKPLHGYNRLKRWIMIGDHHQLPPVIKNMAFQKFSNMEQSLFTRLVHLGVPTVDLDAQGRARGSLCQLYNWRYKKLGNLPHVSMWPEFRSANAGFGFDFQLLNVEDFNGVGESEPNPYFYQNLAEAEYVVAVYMYMRLLGYPAEKISILTTYNGQKHLIRDVIQQRCAENRLIGKPHKVTTVDRYQGQQNDYILLSLVRTRAVGHLRDVRRLIVAMSRARLGLYVFARVALFRNCFELTPAFNQLMQRPQQLYLAPYETFPTKRRNDEKPRGQPLIMHDMPQMAQFVYDFYLDKIRQLAARQSQNVPPPAVAPLKLGVVEKSVREQPRSDQLRAEEHPGAADKDDDDDDDDDDETSGPSKQSTSGNSESAGVVTSQVTDADKAGKDDGVKDSETSVEKTVS